MKLDLALSCLLLVSATSAAETSDSNNDKFHTFHGKDGDTRLAWKKVDVEGFYKHANANANGRHLNGGVPDKIEIHGSEMNQEEWYDINVCNLTSDNQDLKWLPPAGNAVHLVEIPKFSCVAASVTDGQKLCFHSQGHALTSRECQKESMTWADDGDIVFDPYAHYTEISDITGQRAYHGLNTLDPTDLTSYYNMVYEVDGSNGNRYRKLSGGRHLTVATRRSDGQAVHRASPTEGDAEHGHHMWDATYAGQTHTVTVLPDADPDNNGDVELTLQLEAVSVSPRVFEIDHFLTQGEIQHIVELAAESGYTVSTNDHDSHLELAGINRNDSSIMQRVYEKVAAVTKLDPAVFELDGVDPELGHEMQVHKHNKCPGMMAQKEALDKPIVHDKAHGEQFASLILFLNGDESEHGGDLEFKRWEHMEGDSSATSFRIKAKAGKAVLVYQMLPDGNTDEYARWNFTPMQEGDDSGAAGHRLVSTIHISDELVEKTVQHEPIPDIMPVDEMTE